MSGPVDSYSFRDEDCTVFEKLARLHPEFFDGPGWSDGHSIVTIPKRKRFSVCLFPGCGGKPKGYGLCVLHYLRWKRCNEIRTCYVQGCSGKWHSSGLCRVHYGRFQKGQPMEEATLSCSKCGCKKTKEVPFNKSLCWKCYQEKMEELHGSSSRKLAKLYEGSCLICGHSPILALGFCDKHYRMLRLFCSPYKRPNGRTSDKEIVAFELENARNVGSCLFARPDLKLPRLLVVRNNRRNLGIRALILKELAGVPIERGLQIKTKCGNPRCINIDHLFIANRVDCESYPPELIYGDDYKNENSELNQGEKDEIISELWK